MSLIVGIERVKCSNQFQFNVILTVLNTTLIVLKNNMATLTLISFMNINMHILIIYNGMR